MGKRERDVRVIKEERGEGCEWELNERERERERESDN
jgi:hypothetical protein